jgi:hypothetical protein
MQQRIRLAATPDRHHQGISDELRRHCRAHRPADHASGGQVDDRRHIDLPPSQRRQCPGYESLRGCRRFAAALAGDRARLEVDVDRYSFIVSDLHRLLIARLPAHCERFWTLRLDW